MRRDTDRCICTVTVPPGERSAKEKHPIWPHSQRIYGIAYNARYGWIIYGPRE